MRFDGSCREPTRKLRLLAPRQRRRHSNSFSSGNQFAVWIWSEGFKVPKAQVISRNKKGDASRRRPVLKQSSPMTAFRLH